MRRRTRFGLAALLILLVLSGIYTVGWLIFAGRLKDGFAEWAQSARTGKVEISWQEIAVRGFPAVFRIDIEDATFVDRAMDPAPELHISALSISAWPWDLRDWRLAVRGGLRAELAGLGSRPPVSLTAEAATGTLSATLADGAVLWLRLHAASLEAGDRIRTRLADIWVVLPPAPPQDHTEPLVGAAFDLQQVQLPASIRPFGDTIDDLAFGTTVKGVVPAGPLREAVAAWRDSGGTIELDNLQLRWGGLEARATGTLALDQELQPIGGFSGAIEGYDQVMSALVQSGMMRASDAGLARLALTMLAKAGPDGRPQIATSFTIQNGQMFLGPAKLGKAPRLSWE
jgi:hypothetical protein